MQKQNRVIKILKDKSGASFMFVLGITMLLLAIGVSTLVAAGANTGFVMRQREYSQIRLLDDSIHKNILHSLHQDPTAENSLSAKIVMALYDAAADSNPESRDDRIELLDEGVALDVNFDDSEADDELNGGKIKLESVTLSFPKLQQDIAIKPSVPAVSIPIYNDAGDVIGSDDIQGKPETAAVNATMVVTVKISVNKIGAGDKIFTSRAFYKYEDGLLSEAPDGSGKMVFSKPVKWRLIKHENVETVEKKD